MPKIWAISCTVYTLCSEGSFFVPSHAFEMVILLSLMKSMVHDFCHYFTMLIFICLLLIVKI